MKRPKTFVHDECATSLGAGTSTVPAGTTWVVKHIHFNNLTSSEKQFSVFSGNSGTESALFYLIDLPAYESFDWYSPGHALTPAQTIQISASAAASVSVMVSGDEITLG